VSFGRSVCVTVAGGGGLTGCTVVVVVVVMGAGVITVVVCAIDPTSVNTVRNAAMIHILFIVFGGFGFLCMIFPTILGRVGLDNAGTFFLIYEDQNSIPIKPKSALVLHQSAFHTSEPIIARSCL